MVVVIMLTMIVMVMIFHVLVIMIMVMMVSASSIAVHLHSKQSHARYHQKIIGGPVEELVTLEFPPFRDHVDDRNQCEHLPEFYTYIEAKDLGKKLLTPNIKRL